MRAAFVAFDWSCLHQVPSWVGVAVLIFLGVIATYAFWAELISFLLVALSWGASVLAERTQKLAHHVSNFEAEASNFFNAATLLRNALRKVAASFGPLVKFTVVATFTFALLMGIVWFVLA